jgi:phosphoenolpyruvate-protein phosphotransferase
VAGADERSDARPAVATRAAGAVRPSVLVGVPTSPGAGAGPVMRPVGGPHAAGVVVAADLSPGEVMTLDAGSVRAVAMAAGAPLSHAAIVARSRGIPVVTGLGPAVLEIPEGMLVLVDGTAGTVHVAPEPSEIQEASARQRAATARDDEARATAAEPARTIDGHVVPVMANVGTPDEARAAVAAGADGVGMLRTEFAFLDRPQPPGEDEQYEAYRGVADALAGRPLIVRTLDLGADIPAWGGVAEPNPALGNRGLRFTLTAPALFETQLRAVVRVAEERPVRVMFPMVTTVDELRTARACLDGLVDRRASAPSLEVGITVEVPAAAVTAEAFAPLVDFFAIGSNDLTQYTLAADRGNAAVAALADGLHPAVLRLIRLVADAGEVHHRPVEIVGELATDPVAIPVIVGLGVTMLSVRPNAVAAVKQAVRATSLAHARALAEAALDAESAPAVRRLVAAAAP